MLEVVVGPGRHVASRSRSSACVELDPEGAQNVTAEEGSLFLASRARARGAGVTP